MRQQIQEALDDFQLSSKSFVDGTEKLTTDQKFSSPMGELLENFTEEMKKSGYSNKEISDVLDNDYLDSIRKFEKRRNETGGIILRSGND